LSPLVATDMRTMLAALLVLVAAQVQGPRRDAGTPVARPAGTGIIRGRVVAADTRAPIRRAIVTIYGTTTSEAVYTDARGRYEMRNLAPGSYLVRAEPNLYQGQFLPAFIPPPPNGNGPPRLAVADGQIVEAGDLLLPRAGVIAGRVVDENGDPVGNIRVGALGADPRGNDSYQSQNSDEFGRYRLFHLTPGDYVIVVRPSDGGDFLPMGRGQSFGFVETYYPGTYARADARRVRVRGGQETMAGDVQLTRARMMTVRGIVLDSHGTPAVSRTLVALNRRDGGSGSAFIDAQGHFLFRSQPPGAYQVIARMQDESGENTLEYASAALTLADRDLDDVVVAMKPTVNVAGRVVFDTSTAPAMAADTLTMGAQPKDRSMPYDAVSIHPAVVAADLTFTLRRLAGELVVRPNGRVPDNWVLKAVLLNNRDITDVPTEFRAEDSGRLQVVLTTRASELTGNVTDEKGEPPANCTVVLFGEDKAGWFQSSTRFRVSNPGRDGRFSLKGLRAGRYYLIAVPVDRALNSQSVDAAAIERLFKDATPLVLGEDEQRVVDLKLTTPGGGQ
jgi:carboxypeptidase family protein